MRDINIFVDIWAMISRYQETDPVHMLSVKSIIVLKTSCGNTFIREMPGLNRLVAFNGGCRLNPPCLALEDCPTKPRSLVPSHCPTSAGFLIFIASFNGV